MKITGYGLLTAAGSTAAALAGAGAARADMSALHDDLPRPDACAIPGFDIRAELGRKGTSAFDRATGLAIVACGRALADAGVEVEAPERVGLVLGTTEGSLRSTMEYSRETLVQDRPYLVNPVLFPNTVMNCAAGQAAIWFGLKGVNATIAGGSLAFLQSLRYASNALDRGYADTILVGAVEEFTAHRAWTAELAHGRPAGEAAAVFVVEKDPQERTPVAEVLAVAAGFGQDRGALVSCLRRALARAGARPEEIDLMATGDLPGERAESDAVTAVAGRDLPQAGPGDRFGHCGAAAGALALAGVLGRLGDGELAVITGRAADGAVAAAVVKGRGDARADRR
ncbi:beta-ketoacyl synthase N-terminal-like domain-containing protein [Nonomuraea purpurea]|uniref:Beta-ketoacyl synthase N-terminal-like domain-containing protein n=1 Tax=Nonomuraea purpurea TaxID=1849276 RepID=A0ABV8GJL4_9ACTN